MVLDEMNAIHNPWNSLQQPSHASSGITASLRSLLAGIDLGWQVEEPVTVMPTEREDAWIYCFVLTHPVLEQTFQLYAPATLEIVRLVEQNQYQVIEGAFIGNVKETE